MKTLIFSDVHLNVAEDGRETRTVFVRFLRQINPSEYDRIIILGDLFDFWFEYRHVIFSGYFEVLRAFSDLRDAGVQFYFVCGNHDFWAGRFLREYLGFEIYQDTLRLPFGEREALLVHGDGINPADWSYRLYKRVARAKLVVWLFRLIHPDWAMAIAQGVSRGSRHLFSAEDVSKGSEVAPLRAFATKALANGEADVVMCGHSHYPVIEPYPTPDGEGLYINSGDWLWHRSFVVWDGTAFQMHRFEADGESESVSEVLVDQPSSSEA